MKIEIEDKEYDLDVDKALSSGALKEINKYRHIGQHFRHPTVDGCEKLYILTIVGRNEVGLIGFGGCRYHDFIKVKDPSNISDSEWIKITAGNQKTFTPIKIAMEYRDL